LKQERGKVEVVVKCPAFYVGKQAVPAHTSDEDILKRKWIM
jgi:hypothetical protein